MTTKHVKAICAFINHFLLEASPKGSRLLWRHVQKSNTLIKAHAKKGHVGDAKRYLHQMITAGVELTNQCNELLFLSC